MNRWYHIALVTLLLLLLLMGKGPVYAQNNALPVLTRELSLQPSTSGTLTTITNKSTGGGLLISTLPLTTNLGDERVLLINTSNEVTQITLTNLLGTTAWRLTGNAGTDPTTNFLGTTDDQPLIIKTSNVERMRVLSTGNVGIGTNAPVYRLDVSGQTRITTTNTAGLILQRPADVWSADDYNDLLWQGTAGGGVDRPWGRIRVQVSQASGSGSATFMSFYTNSSAANDSERMRLTASGQLGIGTTAPGSLLQVNGGVAIGYSSATAAPTNGLIVSGASTLSGTATLTTLGGTAAATVPPNFDRIVLANSSGVLDEASISSVVAAGVAGSAWALTGNTNTNPTNNFLGTTDAQPLIIKTSNVERMRVLSTGNVGIGTNAPVYRLDVSGQTRITTTNTAGLILQRPADFWIADDYNDLLWQGTAGGGVDRPWGRIRVQVSQASGSGSATFMSFYTNSSAASDSERMRLTATGQLGIGTTAPGSLLQVNGGVAIGYSSATAAPTNGLIVSGASTLSGTATLTTLGGTAAATVPANFDRIVLANSSGTLDQASISSVVAAGLSGQAVTSFSAGTTGLTPSTATTGAVTLAGTLNVANGGTGATTLTSNGVLLGNGTSAISATTAGTADQILRIPSAGGAPGFGSIDLSKSAAVGTSILPIANGGTGAATTSQNFVFAGPTSGSGAPSFRALTSADLPGSFNGFADPTATIGLTAVNGSATTAMRSDAAPALSQAIVPTWTGLHTFTGGITSTGTSAISLGADAAANTISIGNGAAVKTVTLGSTNTTSATTIQSGSGGVNINASNNQPTNINTGTSTGAVNIGTGTSSGTVTIGRTGGNITLNSVATGTSADEVLLINGSNQVTKTTRANLVAGSGWALTGNAGTVAAGGLGNAPNANTNFIGTTDAVTLSLVTNNVIEVQIGSNGVLQTAKDMLVRGVTVGRGTSGDVSSVALGSQALGAISNTGLYNTGVGAEALKANTSGLNNTAVGALALRANTTGQTNTAVGASALPVNTTGGNNTAIGYRSLHSNSTGAFNTAVGEMALERTTTGSDNTALGRSAGIGTAAPFNLTGSNSVFVGSEAQPLSDAQTNQIVIGYQATGLGSNSAILGNSSITATRLQGRVGIGMDPTGASNVTGLFVRAGSSQSTNNLLELQNSAGTALVSVGATGTVTLTDLGGPAASSVPANFDRIVLADSTGALDEASISSVVSGNAWSLVGNTGTSATTNFIGTTDAVDFVIRTDNTERVRITGAGAVATLSLGSTLSPSSTASTTKLKVYEDGGGTVVAGFGYNSFLGMGTLGYHVPSIGTHKFFVNDIEQLSIGSASTRVVNTLILASTASAATADSILMINASNQVTKTSRASLFAGSGWALTGNSITDASTQFLGTTNGQPLAIKTNGAERMRVASDGNVGIGVASPTSRLQVQTTSVGSIFSGTNSTNGASFSFLTDNSGRSALTVTGGNSGSQAGAYFTATGREEAWFNVNATLNTAGLRYMRFGNSSNQVVNAFAIQLLNDAGTAVISTPFRLQNAAPTNSFVVGTDGNVGLGVASPTSKLDVAGTVTATGLATLSGGATVTGATTINTTGTASTTIGNTTAATAVTINAGTDGGLTLGNIQSGSASDNVLLLTSGNKVTKTTRADLFAGSGWTLTGNAGTDSTVNFLGTTDARPLVLKVNGAERVRIDGGGTMTTTEDMVINGVRVGSGGGGIATNTAVGSNALSQNTTGDLNVALGTSAMFTNTTGNSNTATGRDALYSNTTGNNNTAYGTLALRANTIGSFNTAVGRWALHANTEGNSNTAVGMHSLYTNTTGQYNTAMGVEALYTNLAGSYNVALGYQAGKNETGGNKLYIANSETNNLIYGDFSTGLVSINAGSTPSAPGASLQVNAFNASTKGLIVKGAASASANLVEVQNSAGTALVSISSAGLVTATAGVNLSGASSPLQANGSAGNSGEVLTSAGAGNTPTWQSASTAAGIKSKGVSALQTAQSTYEVSLASLDAGDAITVTLEGADADAVIPSYFVVRTVSSKFTVYFSAPFTGYINWTVME